MKNFIFFFCLFALVTLTSATKGAYLAPYGASFDSSIKPDAEHVRINKNKVKSNHTTTTISFPFSNTRFSRSPISTEISEKLAYEHRGRILIPIIFIESIDQCGEMQKWVVIIIMYMT